MNTFRFQVANEDPAHSGPVDPRPSNVSGIGIGTAGYDWGTYILTTRSLEPGVQQYRLGSNVAIQKTDENPWIMIPEDVDDFLRISVKKLSDGSSLGNGIFPAYINTDTFFNGSNWYQTTARQSDQQVILSELQVGDIEVKYEINPDIGVAEPLIVTLAQNLNDLRILSPLVWSGIAPVAAMKKK